MTDQETIADLKQELRRREGLAVKLAQTQAELTALKTPVGSEEEREAHQDFEDKDHAISFADIFKSGKVLSRSLRQRSAHIEELHTKVDKAVGLSEEAMGYFQDAQCAQVEAAGRVKTLEDLLHELEDNLMRQGARVKELEASQDKIMRERDDAEDKIDDIALELCLTEDERTHSNWNDVGVAAENKAIEIVAQVRSLEGKLAEAVAFKTWVHNRLDAGGVPSDPEPENNKKHGCRISGRMNWLFAHLSPAPEEAPKPETRCMKGLTPTPWEDKPAKEGPKP